MNKKHLLFKKIYSYELHNLYEGHFEKFIFYTGCTSNMSGAHGNTHDKVVSVGMNAIHADFKFGGNMICLNHVIREENRNNKNTTVLHLTSNISKWCCFL